MNKERSSESTEPPMMGDRGLARLFTTFGGEDTPCEDTFKVYLRLKPRNENDETTIEVLDSKSVLLKMTEEQKKYTFSNVFSNSSQEEIFNNCCRKSIKDIFDGSHCLLFAHGSSNAGKTYTVQGTRDNPGIIPQTLVSVFKLIGKDGGGDRIMPSTFQQTIELKDPNLKEERLLKAKILSWSDKKYQNGPVKKYNISSTQTTSTDEIIVEPVFMQRRLTNDEVNNNETEPDERFSVWVSFAEIYNESIYDLLQPLPSNCKKKPLKLAQDSNNGNTYIKGLKHIFVESEEEAYRVFLFGKNNLEVAATGVNSKSSRSHSIFTVKLIKFANREKSEEVCVSSFSICDLAGAERQKKTLNKGMRLTESKNINNSIYVLSNCISTIRKNQQNNEKTVIPFRDSKLTQLFQHALLGKETVTMIVNVNSDPLFLEETKHVLKTSAIATHIVVLPRPVTRQQTTTRECIDLKNPGYDQGTDNNLSTQKQEKCEETDGNKDEAPISGRPQNLRNQAATPGRDTTPSNKEICFNCSKDKTTKHKSPSRWRTNDRGEVVCGACFSYEFTYNMRRPQRLFKKHVSPQKKHNLRSRNPHPPI